MTYLGRPVFEFPINWADPVTKSFSFDLREVSVGFGAEVFTALQQFVVQGHEFSMELATEAEIKAYDDFTAALFGRLTGFWLPIPIEEATVINAPSATQLRVDYSAIADSAPSDPPNHIYLVRDGLAPFVAHVTGVAVAGAVETLTVDTVIPSSGTVDSSAILYRLQYVRLADDVEKAKFQAEGWQKRLVRVVELPLEYATAETGERLIWLYHFWCAAPMDVHWYFTSFESDVVSNNVLYTTSPMTHGEIRNTGKLDSDDLTIDWVYDANHPLALFLPIPSPRPMNIEILETTYGTPSVVTRRFAGQVRKVPDGGDKLSATCDSFGTLLGRKVPAMLVQPDCNYMVYEPRTCKVIQAFFETTGTLFSQNSSFPPVIEVTLLWPTANMQVEDWFAQGWLETGTRLGFEVRTIVASKWSNVSSRLTLSLNAPLLKAVNGQSMELIPGCNGSFAICGSKFNNQKNFGGFTAVPEKNLSIASFDHSAAAGDKK